MPVRYILVTLKPGVTAEAYEKWVREYDYKVAATRENLIKYEVYRITSPITGIENPGWTHMERIEVKSLEQSAIDALTPSGVELRRQLWGTYVEKELMVDFVTEVVK
jgi:hypothetical protein